MSSIITLTTDFGILDAYVGVMKGVILGLNPRARLVDLTHSVGPQQVLQGSFLLGTAFRYFPKGTVHLAVVDPGVGSSRRALVVQAGDYYFVAPDNGLLSHVLADLGVATTGAGAGTVACKLAPGMRAVALTNPEFWLHPVSSTFHGRDIFSPVAARLSLGTELEIMGDPVSSVLLYQMSRPRGDAGGAVTGTVVHVDHFGNLITDIRVNSLPDGPIEVRLGGRVVHGLSRSYADATVDPDVPLLAIPGSTGYLDIAARNGNASLLLGVGLGATVHVAPVVRA